MMAVLYFQPEQLLFMCIVPLPSVHSFDRQEGRREVGNDGRRRGIMKSKIQRTTRRGVQQNFFWLFAVWLRIRVLSEMANLDE